MTAATIPPIEGKTTVNVPVEQAFTVFTESFTAWWPHQYHIGQSDVAEVILESHEGGRWYEIGVDGTECDWGRVLVWEPPSRVLFTWQIGGDWQFDPDPAHASEIEVRFHADGPAQTANYGNPNGHVIRMKEASTEATSFTWDIYAFGTGADLDKTNINLSSLDDSNDFSSPDGMAFARSSHAGGQGKPLMWLQTDDGAYTDVTNCMMLAAQPGTVGDGGARTITNTASGGATATQATRIGTAPGANLRRFLVGPVECEITGVDSTPDGRTLFVGIQHPGEGGTPAAPTSHWPDSQAGGTVAATLRPRSAVVVITKNDGGVVGL